MVQTREKIISERCKVKNFVGELDGSKSLVIRREIFFLLKSVSEIKRIEFALHIFCRDVAGASLDKLRYARKREAKSAGENQTEKQKNSLHFNSNYKILTEFIKGKNKGNLSIKIGHI